MGAEAIEVVRGICGRWNNDATRLLDIIRAVDNEFQCVSGPVLDAVAEALSVSRAEVEGEIGRAHV